MEKVIEHSGHRKVLRRVRTLLASHGLQKRKTTFFVRPQPMAVEFIHLHKYSFAPGYRVHLGIRVLNDTFPALALNGPDSHSYTCPNSPNGSRYNFDFGEDELSIQHCANEVNRWCVEIGEPWFEEFRDPLALLANPASPLNEAEKNRLRMALRGEAEIGFVAVSYRLFGLPAAEDGGRGLTFAN